MIAEKPSISLEQLRQAGKIVGIEVLSVTSVAALTADGERLAAWQTAGLAGDLEYMQRGKELLADPRAVFEAARSVVTVGLFYDSGPPPALIPGTGRVARYAWGRDYHKVLRRALGQFCDEVRKLLGGREIKYRVFSDSVPLLERALARRSGLGFIGKNTMLIVPGRGSFLFLGEVLWDLSLEESEEEREHQQKPCGSCTQCLDRCPTQAFVGERILDASRCISYLTIEKRGGLSRDERRMIGSWIFGCDVCQDVCPYNYTAIKTRRCADVEALSRASGVGPLLALRDILAIRSHEAYVARFAGTAIMRARREGLLRNAACVAVNTSRAELIPKLIDAVHHDPSPVVRSHALWAAWELERQSGAMRREILALRDMCLTSDPDEGVQEEASKLEVRS